ncbi:MAG: hypothetical protein LBJ64_04865, partial [Deltaproteobacteria bacterium]|nr:hypothetical protein [Deltaproteobacteria bacterium]
TADLKLFLIIVSISPFFPFSHKKFSQLAESAADSAVVGRRRPLPADQFGDQFGASAKLDVLQLEAPELPDFSNFRTFRTPGLFEVRDFMMTS